MNKHPFAKFGLNVARLRLKCKQRKGQKNPYKTILHPTSVFHIDPTAFHLMTPWGLIRHLKDKLDPKPPNHIFKKKNLLRSSSTWTPHIAHLANDVASYACNGPHWPLLNARCNRQPRANNCTQQKNYK